MDVEDPLHTASLASVNQKAVAPGEFLPAVHLEDGTLIRTGTVATMLRNIEAYNAGARGDVERELVLAVPTLVKIGLFALFPAEEWVAGTNPGRRFVGLEALARQDSTKVPLGLRRQFARP